MQLVKTEKYGTVDRDFEIYTYKDNNNDRVVIEVSEIINSRNITVPCRQEFLMDGNFNLPVEEYEKYPTHLSEIKGCIIIYTAATNK